MLFLSSSAKFKYELRSVPVPRIVRLIVNRLVFFALTLIAAGSLAQTRGILSRSELALLQDPGGWEYVTISDPNNGFQTQAACFNGQPTGNCEGKLFFRSDNTFTQTISGHGKSMHRGGTYKLENHDITLIDEHSNSDGPYSFKVDPETMTLTMDATRAGVGVHMELLLAREFKKRLEQKRGTPSAVH